MNKAQAVLVKNTQNIPLNKIPKLTFPEFRSLLLEYVASDAHVSAFFAVPEDEKQFVIYAVLALLETSELAIFSTVVEESYPSLTNVCPEVNMFEREIYEQWQITPNGHPWLKPVRFQESYKENEKKEIKPGVTEFFKMNGDEVHEVAVGPVHAGVIEPGHFRFQCHGEIVHNLEIALGYQHRGIEKSIVNGPNKLTLKTMEVVAGDTTIGHTLAYCLNFESLGRVETTQRAQVIRAIALELERLANHTGDLGALAGDVGYLPTMSYCGRLRGDYLNLTAEICGNRFGRNLLDCGGVFFDIEQRRAENILAKLEKTFLDTEGAINLMWKSASVLARFENTGEVNRRDALLLGLVGPAARASGVERDVRKNLPCAAYLNTPINIMTARTGDVFARAYVRWLEIVTSVNLIKNWLKMLPNGEINIKTEYVPLTPESMAVTLIEGWRGEICHVAITDKLGHFKAYKIVDPSFHNWFGLAMALRNQQISDFPLCNKSFNLSYCGHDL